MNKILFYFGAFIVGTLVVASLISCSKDNEGSNKTGKTPLVGVDPIIGSWDGAGLSCMEGRNERTIDSEIKYWTDYGDLEYAETLKKLKKQYIEDMRINFLSNNKILVEYSNSELKHEEGTWTRIDQGEYNIEYGSGNFAIKSRLLITEKNKAHYFRQQNTMKIYIQKILD